MDEHTVTSELASSKIGESPFMIAKHLSVQSFALSATVWLLFRCQVMAPGRHPLVQVRVGLGRVENVNSQNLPLHSCSTSVPLRKFAS